MRKIAQCALVTVAVIAGTGSAFAFDPIVLFGPNPSIRLELIGSYRGGMFSGSAVQSAPGLDPDSHRLYVGSAIRREVELIDIGNPYIPAKDRSIELGAQPSAVAFADDVLAVATSGPTKSSPGVVQFFDEDGDPEAYPVAIDPQPAMMAFTPNGNKIVVANTGEANDSYSEDPEGSATVIRLRKQWFGILPEVHRIDFQGWNDRSAELRVTGTATTTRSMPSADAHLRFGRGRGSACSTAAISSSRSRRPPRRRCSMPPTMRTASIH